MTTALPMVMGVRKEVAIMAVVTIAGIIQAIVEVIMAVARMEGSARRRWRGEQGMGMGIIRRRRSIGGIGVEESGRQAALTRIRV